MLSGSSEMNCFKITLVCIISCLFVHAHGLAVMSIDVGSEWMKVAFVSPGVPMEIALNRESQRKTPITIAFRDGERVFGDPAVSIGVRFPEKAFSYLTEILGKKPDNPLVGLYMDRFPYYTLETSVDRNTVVFRHPEGEKFSPEELLAMVLKRAQEIAEKAAGQLIKDAVITVPPFFTQAERYSMLAAAKLSGINVLQLINSNTASALNYGVFRRKDFNETPTHIVFYDMGAGNTVATVVSYQLVKSKETGEVNPQLTVKGIGYDRTLGGLEMQLRLRDHFAKAFNAGKKTTLDVLKNSRAMSKLFKEAGRVKKVLSANTEHAAQVESLLDDKDFRHMITRAQFEEMCSDIFDRVITPLKVALKSSNMNIEEIDQVILAGSGARIPKVQQLLLDYIKKPELGKSINTDESAALGAAYQAAYLSKGFKVKTFLVRDILLYPIQIGFQREYELPDKTPAVKNVKRTLFTRNNFIPQKKAMTFNRIDKDFDFHASYGDLSFLSDADIKYLGSLNLSSVSVNGVQATMTQHTSENVEYKGVKAYFRVDDNGCFHFDSADSVFDKSVNAAEEEKVIDFESTLSRLGNTIGRLFSSAVDEPKETKPDVNKETEPQKDDIKPSATKDTNTSELEKSSNNSNVNDTLKKESEPKSEIKIVTIKEPLTASTTFTDIVRLSESQMKHLTKRLENLDEHDRAKLAKEHAKNALESFIVETKDRLYREEYEQASKDEEREIISGALSETGNWLEYESDEAATEVFQKKLTLLTKLTKDLFDRVKEHHERPEAIKAMKDMLNISEMFYNGAHNMSEDEQIFTEVELKTLGKAISDTKEWMESSIAEQAALPLYEQPKLTMKIMGEKMATLDREVKYLLSKARFAKPLKKKTAPEPEVKNDSLKNETIDSKTTDSENKSETVESVEMPSINLESTETETNSSPVTESTSTTTDNKSEGDHSEL